MNNEQLNMVSSRKAKRVVKRDQQIGIGWFATIAYAFIFIFNVALMITALSFLRQARSASSLASIKFNLSSNVIMAIFWGMLFLLYFLRLLYVLRLDRKRQIASKGERSFLADWQPEMEGQKVASPLVIKYRSSWKSSIILACFVLLIFVFVFGIFSIPLFVWGDQVFGNFLGSFSWVPIPIGIVLIIVICGVVIWSTRTYLNIDVVAFSNGLLKKTSTKEQFIQWQDARLVAVDSMTRIEGERKPIMLEVASKDEMIQFPWVY
jgi:hypothetical protein